MRKAAILLLLAVVAPAARAQTSAPREGDPDAAARQFRVARRLAAEGSSDAMNAFRKVYDLDPKGPLAADALLEQAILLGLPTWPEGMGRLSVDAAKAAAALLSQVIAGFPSSPRTGEAHYRLALIRLEPLPGRDPAQARLDLLAVTTAPKDDPLKLPARYALARIDEAAGADDRARETLQRIVIAAPRSDAGVRSRIGLARIAARRGEFGRSAAWLQEALDLGMAADLEVPALRDLAVRGIARATGGPASGKPAAMPAPLKTAPAVAALPDGGWIGADRRAGLLARWDSQGRTVQEWPLENVAAVAVDPFGRVYAAAGDQVVRVDSRGTTAAASLGRFGPASLLAVDAAGRIWVVDRRGGRLGKIDAGAASPVLVRESRESIVALAWDGRRLVGVEEGPGRVFEVLPDGSTRTIVALELRGTHDLAVDPVGRIAVLDGKAGEVVFVTPDGAPTERTDLKALGLAKPAAIAFGRDGALVVADAATGGLTRIP